MSPKLPRITAADLLRALRRAGWEAVHQRGSHLKLQHTTRADTLVIPMHAGEVLKPKTLQGILNQAGLSVDELVELLQRRASDAQASIHDYPSSRAR